MAEARRAPCALAEICDVPGIGLSVKDVSAQRPFFITLRQARVGQMNMSKRFFTIGPKFARRTAGLLQLPS